MTILRHPEADNPALTAANRLSGLLAVLERHARLHGARQAMPFPDSTAPNRRPQPPSYREIMAMVEEREARRQARRRRFRPTPVPSARSGDVR